MLRLPFPNLESGNWIYYPTICAYCQGYFANQFHSIPTFLIAVSPCCQRYSIIQAPHASRWQAASDTPSTTTRQAHPRKTPPCNKCYMQNTCKKKFMRQELCKNA